MSEPDFIEVPILTRVEGEGGVTIQLRDGKVFADTRKEEVRR